MGNGPPYFLYLCEKSGCKLLFFYVFVRVIIKTSRVNNRIEILLFFKPIIMVLVFFLVLQWIYLCNNNCKNYFKVS